MSHYKLRLDDMYTQALNLRDLGPEQTNGVMIHDVLIDDDYRGLYVYLVLHMDLPLTDDARQVIYDVLGFCWNCSGTIYSGTGYWDCSKQLRFSRQHTMWYPKRCPHFDTPPLVALP